MLALGVAVLAGVFMPKTAVFALSPTVQIQGETTIPYPTNAEGAAQQLSVANFDFAPTPQQIVDGEYSVQYLALKNDDNSYAFAEISKLLPVTQENPNATFSYNFFKQRGVGSFRVKAAIFKQQTFVAMANEVTFTISKPIGTNALSYVIEMQQIGTTGNNFALHSFELVVTQNNAKVPLENYEVVWQYTLDGGAPVVCGEGASITWAPEVAGKYAIRASVKDLNVVNYEKFIGYLGRDYSLYALLVFGGIALVATGIVITATVLRVRRERVW